MPLYLSRVFRGCLGLALAADPVNKRHKICMILYQLFIPHIIQYKNIADILPFSRHFVYILHRWKTLRRKNGQRVRIRWRRHFPQSFSKNNTILTTTWSFIRFLHWILNDAEQERIQTSHGAERGETRLLAESQPQGALYSSVPESEILPKRSFMMIFWLQWTSKRVKHAFGNV